MPKSIILLASLLLLGSASGTRAQVETITLRVDGLACPFCAYGLEKKLKKIEGTKSLNVLINAGEVIVQWDREKPLTIAAVGDAVDRTGFTLRGIKGSFVGTIRQEGGGFVLLLATCGTQQRLALLEPEPPSDRQRLEHLATSDQMVRVTGSVHGHSDSDHPITLEMESLEPIER